MASKWSPEAERTALLSMIYHAHNGSPKMDRATCVQLEADLVDYGITAEAARQHLQKKLLRNFTPNTSGATTTDTFSAMSAKTSPATPKRKALISPNLSQPKKRTKKDAAAVDHEKHSSAGVVQANDPHDISETREKEAVKVKAETAEESE